MKTIKIILVIVLYLNISSCSKKQERSSSFIFPLKIEMTSVKVYDPEIVEIITISEKHINEYSDNIEMIAIKGEELINKNKNSLTIIEGLEITKIMLDFYSNNTRLQNTIDEFEDFLNKNKNLGRINKLQAESLSLILLRYKQRVNQLKNKYHIYYER